MLYSQKSNRKVQPRGKRALMVSITPSVFSNLQTDQWDLIVTHLCLCKETKSKREARREEKRAPKLYIQQGCKSAFPSVCCSFASTTQQVTVRLVLRRDRAASPGSEPELCVGLIQSFHYKKKPKPNNKKKAWCMTHCNFNFLQ